MKQIVMVVLVSVFTAATVTVVMNQGSAKQLGRVKSLQIQSAPSLMDTPQQVETAPKAAKAPMRLEIPVEDVPAASTSETLTRLDGSKISLQDYIDQTSGNIRLIYFWATWCGVCIHEIPNIQAVADQFAANDVLVTGFSVDKAGLDTVAAFVKDQNIKTDILVADQGVTSTFGGVNGIPTSFLMDRDGKMIKKFVGAKGKAAYEEAIKQLL